MASILARSEAEPELIATVSGVFMSAKAVLRGKSVTKPVCIGLSIDVFSVADGPPISLLLTLIAVRARIRDLRNRRVSPCRARVERPQCRSQAVN